MPTYHCKHDRFSTRSFAKLAKHYRTKHAAAMKAARSRAFAKRKASGATRGTKRSRRGGITRPGEYLTGPDMSQMARSGGYMGRMLPICYCQAAGGTPHVHA